MSSLLLGCRWNIKKKMNPEINMVATHNSTNKCLTMKIIRNITAVNNNTFLASIKWSSWSSFTHELLRDFGSVVGLFVRPFRISLKAAPLHGTKQEFLRVKINSTYMWYVTKLFLAWIDIHSFLIFPFHVVPKPTFAYATCNYFLVQSVLLFCDVDRKILIFCVSRIWPLQQTHCDRFYNHIYFRFKLYKKTQNIYIEKKNINKKIIACQCKKSK